MDLTKREKYGLIVFIIIIISLLALSYYKNNKATAIDVIAKNPTNEKTSDLSKIHNNLISVYICGEITKPGVYELKDGDRLYKLIEMAGGFTKDSDREAVNLSEKLVDEAFIKIPGILTDEQGNRIHEKNTGISSDGKININSASLEELKGLPRIGDAIAQRIIDYRETKGSFKTIEELSNVSGIGDKIYEGLKDKITVR